jgi:ketosteroid isomerase-like protein
LSRPVVLPGENVNRYPDTVDPAQRLLELERGAAPKELPLPRKLEEKDQVTLPRHVMNLAFAAMLALPAVAQEPAPGELAPREAVRRVLDDQAAAWNRRDLDGFMAGYWKSAELSFFAGGVKTVGWQATLERYRKKYQGEGKEMGKLAFSELAIDVLAADYALVKGRWRLTLTKETPGGLFTLIMRKLPEGWRIIHDHTSAE